MNCERLILVLRAAQQNIDSVRQSVERCRDDDVEDGQSLPASPDCYRTIRTSLRRRPVMPANTNEFTRLT